MQKKLKIIFRAQSTANWAWLSSIKLSWTLLKTTHSWHKISRSTVTARTLSLSTTARQQSWWNWYKMLNNGLGLPQPHCCCYTCIPNGVDECNRRGAARLGKTPYFLDGASVQLRRRILNKLPRNELATWNFIFVASYRKSICGSIEGKITARHPKKASKRP